ncbi:MAG TPA: nucleoside monophosphate kinase, partial [Acidimicrobiia bacterium]|nr:nucleoside monophosphate kinase [Acidimicrobiia bacterium]
QRLLGPGGLDAAVDIDVPTEVVLKRLSGRRVCRTCGATYHVDHPPKVDWLCDRDGGDVVQREDDKPEAISRRLELYERETGPLLDFYEGLALLVTVDGDGEADDVYHRIIDGVEAVRQLRFSSPQGQR